MTCFCHFRAGGSRIFVGIRTFTYLATAICLYLWGGAHGRDLWGGFSRVGDAAVNFGKYAETITGRVKPVVGGGATVMACGVVLPQGEPDL